MVPQYSEPCFEMQKALWAAKHGVRRALELVDQVQHDELPEMSTAKVEEAAEAKAQGSTEAKTEEDPQAAVKAEDFTEAVKAGDVAEAKARDSAATVKAEDMTEAKAQESTEARKLAHVGKCKEMEARLKKVKDELVEVLHIAYSMQINIDKCETSKYAGCSLSSPSPTPTPSPSASP